ARAAHQLRVPLPARGAIRLHRPGRRALAARRPPRAATLDRVCVRRVGGRGVRVLLSDLFGAAAQLQGLRAADVAADVAVKAFSERAEARVCRKADSTAARSHGWRRASRGPERRAGSEPNGSVFRRIPASARTKI